MNYSYDAASELTGITYTLGTNTLGTLSYAYDAAGRRTGVGGSYARTGVPTAASAATYNVNNQLTNWKGATLTYDANGNLTSDGSFSFWIFLLKGSDTWNARNQLVSISGGVNASFQYDPFGRRVSKTIGGTTQFLYDGANPVQEISGSSTSANLLTGGVDEYFQRTDSAGVRSFLTDALGSALALADSTGTLQTSYTFEPFGNTTVTGSSTTNSFAYTGREFDTTGLYFYRSRYYSPGFQRFASEDPLQFLGGTANLYGYVFNNPTYFTDPYGNCPACIIGAIGGVIGGTVAGVEAYKCGARGWKLAAAIAGGTGAGILAGITGTWVSFAAAPLIGSSLGIGAGTFGAQVLAGAVGGAAGGTVSGVSNTAISLGTGGNANLGEIGVGAVEGAALGAVGVALGPTVPGGANFDPFTSPATFGPKAGQAYGQALISGGLGAGLDLDNFSGRKDACHK